MGGQLRRQQVEQGRVARLVLFGQVIDRVNQPAAEDLNQLSTDAANAANSEAAALGNQQAELNSENAAADDTTNPTDEQEQNVSGM